MPDTIKRLFFRSALFRWLLFLALALLCAGGTIISLRYLKVFPVITSIDPPVATGGDILTITGRGFSASRNTGYVEIGGNPITGSGYLSWADDKIILRLPPNIKDGLVCVVTAEGRSEPKIFSNSVSVPLPVRSAPATPQPKILSINKDTIAPGRLLVITGENFGESRNNALVKFIPSPRQTGNPGEITPSQSDFDYESWTGNEIRVRVPDGAVTGTVGVVTENGASNTVHLNVSSPGGEKIFDDKRTYLVSLSADISNMVAEDTASLILRVPRPLTDALQRQSEMRECSPEPVIRNYNNMVIHQVQAKQIGREKKVFSQNFLVTVNAVTCTVAENRVQPYSEKGRLLYKVYTTPDSLVQSDDARVSALAKEIVKKETNPLRQARLVYDHILSAYSLLNGVRAGNPSPLDMISRKTGDAYDFAILFAALVRSLGIPCAPVAGVLVENSADPRPRPLADAGALGSLQTRSHWWALFYLEDFGWFPVDPALGAGLHYSELRHHQDRASYYFGSLDSQHIAFSNGWKAVKPSLVNSKSVYRPRTYAFQSIWEEASATVREYSSFWNDPVILAMY
jgi:transglutaminase-like putative cysteine protease